MDIPGQRTTTLTAFQNNIAVQVLQKQKEKVTESQEESEIVEEKWKEVKEAVSEAATNTIGPKPKENKREWLDEDCKKAINDKKNE